MFDIELETAIASIGFLSLKEKILVRKNIDSLDKLALSSIEDFSLIAGRSIRASYDGAQTVEMAKKSVAIMSLKNVNAVLYGAENYPALLTTIDNPPYLFFYRGNIKVFEKPCVSVVGTRNICQETAQAAYDFSRMASLSGQTVISGLAYGIDTWAHKGAIASEVGEATAAILPCGIETVVPYGNRKLAEMILAQGGCIAGEYIPGTPAEPFRFVCRNRLIAALSPSTVVIQAPKGSGALITANFALEYNRDVIFHEAAFCENAKRIAAKSEKKNSKYSPEFYLNDGAPVIRNYTEYVEVRNDAPGSHIRKGQPEFDFG